MDTKTRIVKGIADSYAVREAVDAITEKPYLEVFEHVQDMCSNGFVGDWLGDIECTMSSTDSEILDEIDALL